MKLIIFKESREGKFSLAGRVRDKYNVINKSRNFDDHFDASDEMLMCKAEAPESLHQIIEMNTLFKSREHSRLYFIDEACDAGCNDTRQPLFPGCNALHVIMTMYPGAKQAELKSRNVFFSGDSWYANFYQEGQPTIEVWRDGSIGVRAKIEDAPKVYEYAFYRHFKEFLDNHPGRFNDNKNGKVKIRKFLKTFVPIPMEDQKPRLPRRV